MSSDKFDLDVALNDESTPAGLRDWAKSVQKTNKELADKLAGFEKDQRSNTLKSAFKEAGVNEKLASFYPSDHGTSGEDVAAWLKEYADVFGVKPADTATTTSTTTGDHNPMLADIQAMQRVQQATPTGGSTQTLADKAAEIDKLDMRRGKPEDRAALDSFNEMLMKMAATDQNNHFASMR